VTQAANPTLTKLKKISNDIVDLYGCDEEKRWEIYRELREVIRIVERKAYLVQKLRRKIRAMKKRNLKFKGAS
jgi:uncharacterized protein YjaG (DUF416 family)